MSILNLFGSSTEGEEVAAKRTKTKKTISTKGLDLVKHFEGWYPNAYKCPADVWTIGYGHTKTAKPGMFITEEEGLELLKSDMNESEKAVNSSVTVPLFQHEFDALVAFTFNVGGGALKGSTLLSLLNQGNYDAVPTQLNRWTKGGGRTLPGLVRRRRAEGVLFSTGENDFS